MGKSKGNPALGCLLVLAIGGIIYLWTISPIYGIGALVLGLILLMAANWQKDCQICGNPIKRDSYTWTMDDGQKKRVCPKCNQTLERRQSREAIKKYL